MQGLTDILRRVTLAGCAVGVIVGGYQLAEEVKRQASTEKNAGLVESMESVYSNLSVHLAMKEQMGPRLVLEDLRKKIAEVKNSGLTPRSNVAPWSALMILSLVTGMWMIHMEIGPAPALRKKGRRWTPWKESFVHACSDGIVEVDEALSIRYANPAAERILGYAGGELDGKKFSTVLPAAGSRRQAASRFRSRELARRKNGQTVLVDVSVHKIAHDTGAVVTALTLREAVHELVAPPEGGPDDFFQWAPVPLFVFDRDGRVLQMNRSAEMFTGFAAAEAGINPYWEVFQDEKDAAGGKSDFESSLFWRDRVPSEQVWTMRDRRRVPVRLLRVVMQDRNGLPSNVVAAVIAAEAAPSVDFTQLADHLTAVSGYAELLLMSMPENDAMRPDLEQIQVAGAAAVRELASAANLVDNFKEQIEV